MNRRTFLKALAAAQAAALLRPPDAGAALPSAKITRVTPDTTTDLSSYSPRGSVVFAQTDQLTPALNPLDYPLYGTMLDIHALRPDLIILDLNLPKKHGQAVLADIKSTPDLCRIPVVIFSTSQARQDIVRSYELGANCYVSKPGNLTDFFSAIQSIEKFWLNFVNLPPRGE